jgi:hypothetical protein
MTYQTLTYAVAGRVATITLDRTEPEPSRPLSGLGLDQV